MKKKENIFVILALGFLGDTLLIEPLCQNIRNNYPDSKIIVVVNDIFKEVIYGFKSVDEVYGYDKTNKHKGFLGYLKFKKEFPYKNQIDYAIITHPHERSILISKAIGSKNIISLSVGNIFSDFFINKKIKYTEEEIRNTYKADYNLKYVEPLFKPEKLPVIYERTDINYNEIKQKFNLPDKYIVLSPTSKDLIKDWDYEDIKTFIEKSKSDIVLVGTQKAYTIAKKLQANNIKFIDLSNKTNITELGVVIKMADICISVDTGTFHFAYSQGVKTIGIFFNSKMINEWAPQNLKHVKILEGIKEQKNNEIILIKNITANEVIREIESLINV